MADAIRNLIAQSALPAGGHVYDDVLRLTALPPRTVLRLQLAAKSRQSLDKLLVAGRPVPEAMNTWLGEDPAICRIAPETWLVISTLHEAAELMDAVRTACAKRSFAAADLSDAHVTIAVEGPRAADILVRGCGIDIETLADDACLRTRFAQLPVVLRRAGFDRYELTVDRAVAKYLFEWLQDAAAGLD